MIFCIIVAGVVLVFLIALSLSIMNEDNSDFGTGLVSGVVIASLFVAEILMIYNISTEDKPKAIDVYRNKTELEITSVNGVPTDTVVVWKDELLKK